LARAVGERESESAEPVGVALTESWRCDVMRGLSFGLRLTNALRHYGQRNIPVSGPFMVVSNHPSYLDPVFIGHGMRPWIHWLCWDEAFEWPLVGPWVRGLGAIPVNLEKPGAIVMRGALQVLRERKALGIFFEGKRSDTPLLDPPQPGAASLALRTGTPILPVTISGAFRCWNRYRSWPRFGQVSVIFHRVIPVERERKRSREREEELTEELRRRIAAPLSEDGAAWRPTMGRSVFESSQRT
jgi:1-acyl-sn-glycerol-3-phosphate acyltransferase